MIKPDVVTASLPFDDLPRSRFHRFFFLYDQNTGRVPMVIQYHPIHEQGFIYHGNFKNDRKVKFH